MATDLKTAEDVQVTIDTGFQKLLPPLTETELEDLRFSIEKEGRFRESIKTWGENNAIIDGMNRYQIWCGLPEETEIPPPAIESMDEKLATREDVELWMLMNQLGRRNLSGQAMSETRGRLFNLLKRNLETPEKQGSASLGQNGVNSATKEGRPSTAAHDAAKQVANQTKSSPPTVRRDGNYVTALDAISKVNSKAANDIRSKEIKVSKKDVISIGKLPATEIGKAIKNIRLGQPWNHGFEGNGVAPAMSGIPTETPVESNGKPPKQYPRSHWFKQWEQTIGPLVRIVDKISKEVGEPGSPSKRKIHNLLNEATEEMTRWME